MYLSAVVNVKNATKTELYLKILIKDKVEAVPLS